MRHISISNVSAPILLLAVLSAAFDPSPALARVDSWTAAGPEGGNVDALIVDPVNSSRIYAGTNGGVFQSTDGGATWSTSSEGLTDSFVLSLAIDPTSTSTLFAGTGNGGVFKSNNRGLSWFTVTDPRQFPDLATASITSLVIDPQSPDTLYAGTSRGVFRSANGGGDWTDASLGLSESIIVSLAIDPSNPAIVYAGTLGDGVFKTTNGGGAWAAAGPGFSDIWSLAVDPSTPTTLYAGSDLGVFKSVDSGANWTLTLDLGPNPFFNAIDTVVVDPSTPSTVYAGTWTDHLYKSIDGGGSWSPVSQGLTSPAINVLSISPHDTATIFAGTGSPGAGNGTGVFRSTDGGETWSAMNHGLTATSISALAVGSQTPFPVVAGDPAGTVFRSGDQGASWSDGLLGFDNRPINDLVFVPSSTSVFAATSGRLFRSLDGGETWGPADFQLTRVQDLEASQLDPTTLYAASRSSGVFSVHKSTNGGETWTATGPEVDVSMETLTIHPTNPMTLYAGSTFGQVFKTTDGGMTWNVRDNGLANGEIIYALAATPTSVLAGTLNGLFATSDGGANWNLVTRDFIARVIAVDPANPDVIYAGTAFRGVQRSLDGGTTWAEFNTGLAHQRIEALAIDASAFRRIYAATPGGGVFFRDTNPDCGESTVLCLHDERFHVTVDWKTDSLDGRAQAVPFGTKDSGLFTFFDEDNWELLVKVLDGCGFNQRFWVFSAATTNVEYTLTVTDRVTGESASYFNPPNTVAAAVTDTDALADACSGLPAGAKVKASERSLESGSALTLKPTGSGPTASRPTASRPTARKVVDVVTEEGCFSSDTVACVGKNGRFRVAVEWRDFDGNEGPGRSVADVPSQTSGLFYFFAKTIGKCCSKCSTPAPSTTASGFSPPPQPTWSIRCE